MAASVLQNVRFCARIISKCNHINVRSKSRTPKHNFLQQAKIKEYKFVSFPRLSSIHDREILPEDMKSYTEKMKEMKAKKFDPELDTQINIGYSMKTYSVNRITKRKHRQAMIADPEMERKTRLGEVVIDPLDVQDVYCLETGFANLLSMADHYGIYKDLYGDAYFYPQMRLGINYDIDEEYTNPVFNGNILEASEVQNVPRVEYDGKSDKLFTLCMSGPDSHLQFNDKEYLHWLIGNIPGDSIKDGEELCNYLPPFPIKGTGLHRYVFVLYEQNKKLDFREDKRPQNCNSLRERTFHTYEFYRKYQDDMTPVALAFFQSEWDKSVTNVFWDILDMKEPGFEFVPQRKVIEKQKIWPHKEPFHIYMDRYRDIKDINEEVLKEKLKKTDPFKPREPKPKYPSSFKIPNSVPTWLKLKMEEQRQKKNQWKDLDD